MQLAERSDGEILAVVEPMMDSRMRASTDIDRARHVADFTDRLKAIVTPAHLDKVCRDYQSRWGFFTRREPVAVFRRVESVVVVWKQWPSNTGDEFVAELVLVEPDGRYLVDHVVFFRVAPSPRRGRAI